MIAGLPELRSDTGVVSCCACTIANLFPVNLYIYGRPADARTLTD